MRLREIWRFPVKSMGGEQVDEAEVGPAGVDGDRAFALFDTQTGFGLTARREPSLLFASAALRPDGNVRITLPDGTEAVDDQALSQWLGRPVTLRSADEPGQREYENPSDFEDEQQGWEPFDGSPGAFHDTADASVSLVSTASVGDWDLRRFRANLILETTGDEHEDQLVGQSIELGTTRLSVRERIARCVMVTRPQPDGIERDLDVLRRIHRERGGELAVGGVVTAPGRIRVGDELRVLAALDR